jgi:hypothetical protein
VGISILAISSAASSLETRSASALIWLDNATHIAWVANGISLIHHHLYCWARQASNPILSSSFFFASGKCFCNDGDFNFLGNLGTLFL